MVESSISESGSAQLTSEISDEPQSVLWQVTILPRDPQYDRLTREAGESLRDAEIDPMNLVARRGFLIQGPLSGEQIESLAELLLVDPVVETCTVSRPATQDDDQLLASLLHVLPLPGVTDCEAETVLRASREIGFEVEAVRTFRCYDINEFATDLIPQLRKILSNPSIEQVVEGPLRLTRIELGQPYRFALKIISLVDAGDERLQEISVQHQLSLTLVEMQTIQRHFAAIGRDPTDAELETIAQTWSEHCSHKTLAGKIAYTDENGTRHFDNMLKETIFAATTEIRGRLGKDDWCVSVFEDNAGIVRFDDVYNVTFKVETHNRPSALEPYGGANTGIGGVIRDTLGTGLGARPICSTDVFCFASPDTAAADLPPGVLHPRRVMKGVVAGVRDYGNRMGIPTVNGAVCFDERYIGNPLVFCGNVGLIPHDKSFKQPQPNDLIVAIGGRTGRDGIHGATFSSAELTDSSETTSGGAVQIGNAIVEKMVMDVLLAARDENLFNAVTDCGAGGFSSAVGEMGEEIGAEVWLDRAPLKYEGLSYTEIWISEAQERMVFAVPEEKWSRFEDLCRRESVEATVIGTFSPTGNLTLKYEGQTVGELSMQFLHDGRPPVVREARFTPKAETAINERAFDSEPEKLEQDLLAILSSPNVASKHWIIRQYDHEVLGGSVVKPLVGVCNDGPSDAAVIRPRIDSRRGLAIACGINPRFGDLDPYHMAASVIDEAIRNCVAVGADPDRIAILDNFCWGYTDRVETLGSLVRAAIACHDVAVDFQTPFISGKDSLNNEFSYTDQSGLRQTISIPSTLLISAMGQVTNVDRCITMDLKKAGNLIYVVGPTLQELGGSHWSLVNAISGGSVPKVDACANLQRYRRLHTAIQNGWVRSCHDLSEGGLAVAAAEMAFAGGLGMQLDVQSSCEAGEINIASALFSESNGRLLCEVPTDCREQFELEFGEDVILLGSVQSNCFLEITASDAKLISAELSDLKDAWRRPLDWK